MGLEYSAPIASISVDFNQRALQLAEKIRQVQQTATTPTESRELTNQVIREHEAETQKLAAWACGVMSSSSDPLEEWLIDGYSQEPDPAPNLASHQPPTAGFGVPDRNREDMDAIDDGDDGDPWNWEPVDPASKN